MATHTAVEINLLEAAELADLTGIEYDLRKTREFIDRLRAVYSADKFDPAMAEALSTAILITYARAFVTGVRGCLRPEVIPHLRDDLKTEARGPQGSP